MKRVLLIIALSCVLLILNITPAQADLYDLTAPGAVVNINNALFYEIHAAPTGSGAIDSFVRLGGKDIIQGYNSDYRPLLLNENNSPTFTHSLLLSDVPVVTINNIDYREFLLDINQNNNNPLLSLDSLKIYINDSGDYSGDPAEWEDPVYDLGNVGIKLDYSLNPGSGKGDMLAYLPNELFEGGTYVCLYSMFGSDFANNAGFEEWAVRTPLPVTQNPIPNAVFLGLLGIIVAGIKLRKYA